MATRVMISRPVKAAGPRDRATRLTALSDQLAPLPARPVAGLFAHFRECRRKRLPCRRISLAGLAAVISSHPAR